MVGPDSSYSPWVWGKAFCSDMVWSKGPFLSYSKRTWRSLKTKSFQDVPSSLWRSTSAGRCWEKTKWNHQSTHCTFAQEEPPLWSSWWKVPRQSTPWSCALRFQWTLWYHRTRLRWHRDPFEYPRHTWLVDPLLSVWNCGNWCGKWVDPMNHLIPAKSKNINVWLNTTKRLHNQLEGGVMNATGLLAHEAWLEKDFWAAETFRSHGDDVAIRQLVSLLLVTVWCVDWCQTQGS